MNDWRKQILWFWRRFQRGQIDAVAFEGAVQYIVMVGLFALMALTVAEPAYRIWRKMIQVSIAVLAARQP